MQKKKHNANAFLFFSYYTFEKEYKQYLFCYTFLHLSDKYQNHPMLQGQKMKHHPHIHTDACCFELIFDNKVIADSDMFSEQNVIILHFIMVFI